MCERHGPRLSASCHGCEFYRQERFDVQGDRGYDGYCKGLPDGGERHIGSYSSCAKTPEWCPEMSDEQRTQIFGDSATRGQ